MLPSVTRAGIGSTVEGSEWTLPQAITAPAAATDLVTSKVTGDTNDRFVVNADGKLEWGPGNAALDSNLFRDSTNALKTGDHFRSAFELTAQHEGAAQTIMGAQGPAGESGVLFGLAGDTNLYRSAANTLTTDDTLLSKAEIYSVHGGLAQVQVGSAAFETPGVRFGVAQDTNLYRSAANTLKTDDRFDAALGLALPEMTAPAGVADAARIYAEDNGAGKTRLMVIFGSGAAQQIAIEP